MIIKRTCTTTCRHGLANKRERTYIVPTVLLFRCTVRTQCVPYFLQFIFRFVDWRVLIYRHVPENVIEIVYMPDPIWVKTFNCDISHQYAHSKYGDFTDQDQYIVRTGAFLHFELFFPLLIQPVCKFKNSFFSFLLSLIFISNSFRFPFINYFEGENFTAFIQINKYVLGHQMALNRFLIVIMIWISILIFWNVIIITILTSTHAHNRCYI